MHPPDIPGVLETITQYLDGLYHGNTDLLEKALHPEARYVCAVGDTLINLLRAEYLPIVARRTAPASLNAERRDQITDLQFAGPKTAFVRLNCAVAERYFTDFLTLIKDHERWQIISKVFHYDILPET